MSRRSDYHRRQPSRCSKVWRADLFSGLFRFLTVFIWLFFGSRVALADSVAWAPEKTRAVVVGVLSWQNPAIGTFPAENRQDLRLYQTLLERGVPEHNVSLLLDEKADRQAVLEALQEQTSRLQQGDTFLFYYAGHGIRDKSGQVLFLPYDYSPGNGLSMRDIGDKLFTSKADRVLLFADCCHSGALEEVALSLEEHGVKAASLSSATAELTSTSNWTFTQALIDGLSGTPASDRNGDLRVTLAETMSDVADAMRFYEHQQSGASNRSWLDEFVLASAPPVQRQLSPPYSLYDYVMIEYEDKKGIGRLQGGENTNLVVELQAYSQRVPLEVPIEHLRPVPNPPVPVEADKARELASVDGKYSQLLTVLEVEPDYLEYSEFSDHGFYPACSYRGYSPVPAGHWVYVYPRWYIWGESLEGI